MAIAAAVLTTLVGDGTAGSRSWASTRPCPSTISARESAGLPGGCASRARRAGAPNPRHGSAGLGDRYFPKAGNGGYNAGHYDVVLAYAPKGGRVNARVTMYAIANADLSSFNLDFRGLRISGVRVNGRPATYRRTGKELTITPPSALRRGRAFTVMVSYSGSPRPLNSPRYGLYGWIPTRDGAVVMAEPNGAPTWLPVNDHPRDKATYRFEVTVPKGLRVMANGQPGPVSRRGNRTTFVWLERSPMASYLAMIAIGKFTVRHGSANGVPVITAVDPKFREAATRIHRTTIAAVRWQSRVFGPYPFATTGGIVEDPRLDYALETQERPVYAGFAPDTAFIVHELAHQWFGDSVSLKKWSDIWLNEGLATYAEWLWRERTDEKAAQKIFESYSREPADSPVFNPPPGAPGRREMFAQSVYVRGAMGLHALRRRVGDKSFFRLLRTWPSVHRHGNATTREFIALAERISRKQLDGLFRAWLYTKGKPDRW